MRLRKIESPLTATPLRTRILRGLCVFLLALFVVPALLGLGLGALLVSGLERESDQRIAPAREALQAVGMGDFEEFAEYYALEGCGVRAFHISEYDNHEEQTDLHALLLSCAGEAEGWTVAPVTAAEYAAQLPPEMAFLLPKEGLVFEASYRQGNTAAFFDDETGLFLCFLPGKTSGARQIKAAGLTVSTGGWMYEMDTHAGFFGDGYAFKACIVPAEERAALKAAISAHADWHEGSIFQAEYARLHQTFYKVPELYPAADTVFDAWYYVDDFARQHPDFEPSVSLSNAPFPAVMQEAGAVLSGNWTVAFYDADTGLFIFYEFDS